MTGSGMYLSAPSKNVDPYPTGAESGGGALGMIASLAEGAIKAFNDFIYPIRDVFRKNETPKQIVSLVGGGQMPEGGEQVQEQEASSFLIPAGTNGQKITIPANNADALHASQMRANLGLGNTAMG